jgi:hypothetical protein
MSNDDHDNRRTKDPPPPSRRIGRPKKEKATGPPPNPIKDFSSLLQDIQDGEVIQCRNNDGSRVLAVCPGMAMICALCVKVLPGFPSAAKHFTENNCPNYAGFLKAKQEEGERKKAGVGTFVIIKNAQVSHAVLLFSAQNHFVLTETVFILLFSDRNHFVPTETVFILLHMFLQIKLLCIGNLLFISAFGPIVGVDFRFKHIFKHIFRRYVFISDNNASCTTS